MTNPAIDRIMPKPRRRYFPRTPEYRAWCAMIDRCENPNAPAHYLYGLRGIVVCPEWRASFKTFFAALGPRPTPGHSIDRIDNDKGYEPGNVRWATRQEQNINRSCTVYIEAFSRKMCMAEWARFMGLTYDCLLQRIRVRKWTTERALITRPRGNTGLESPSRFLAALAELGVSND